MKTYNMHAIQGANGLDGHEITEMEVLRAAQRARADAIGGWLEAVSHTVGRWLKARFYRAHANQRVINELNAMDERMLSDIGITRGDIPFVAAGQSRLRNPREGDGVAAA